MGIFSMEHGDQEASLVSQRSIGDPLGTCSKGSAFHDQGTGAQ